MAPAKSIENVLMVFELTYTCVYNGQSSIFVGISKCSFYNNVMVQSQYVCMFVCVCKYMCIHACVYVCIYACMYQCMMVCIGKFLQKVSFQKPLGQFSLNFAGPIFHKTRPELWRN